MNKLSKRFYLGSIIFSYVLLFVWINFFVGGYEFIIRIEELREAEEYSRAFKVIAFGLIPMIVFGGYIIAVTLVLVYKSWKSIQDEYTRITPRKAIGLLFVPLFNIYWIYRVFFGFAKTFNSYIDPHNINTKKLNEQIFLSLPIVITLWPILSFVYIGEIRLAPILLFINYLAVVSKMCDAVNSLVSIQLEAQTSKSSQ